MKRNQKGSVLIMTLIVVTFLSALALKLGHLMRSKNMMVRNYQHELTSLYIARGALGRVMSAIESDKKENVFDGPDDAWVKKYMKSEHVPKVLEWRDGRNRPIGEYTVRIIDESSKVNINTAALDNLKLLLDAFDGVESGELAGAIIDYRDDDGEGNVFYTIHDLLLLNGIEQGAFFGEDSNENSYVDEAEKAGFIPDLDYYDRTLRLGIKDYVTVFTNGKINLNTAPLEVLLSMPGISKEMANGLIKHRKLKSFSSLDEIKTMLSLSDEVFAKIVRWANVQSDWYKIIIHARAEGGNQVKTISAYVDRIGERSKIKYWREN